MCIISVYMHSQRINITLPGDVARDLRQTIPARSRSKFISEALKEKLDKKRNLKKEWIKALKANYEYNKKVAEEWSVTEVEGWPD